MYYNQQDFNSITKQLKRTIILLLGILVVFLIAAILTANLVTNRVGMVVMIVGVCLDVFLWGIYANPILAYYRFIRDLVTGRTREIQGLVKEISERPVYKDNKLYYYELTIEDDGIERVLLLDNQKNWPKLNFNRLYSFEIHENYVKDLNQIS